MILNEIYSREPEAYQDLSQDNSQPQLHNLRKTRLTLKQINELRRASDLHIKEHEAEMEFISRMYATPVAAE
jgi:hypothetical protein